MSRPNRRGLLAGMSALGAMGVPTIAAATPSHVGPVEALVRCLPGLDRAQHDADEARARCRLGAECDSLWEAWEQAADALKSCEDAALAAAPETVTDALLLIAMAATRARDISYCAMDGGFTAKELEKAARISRRAADFIAASMGRDLGALLGSSYDHPVENEA